MSAAKPNTAEKQAMRRKCRTCFVGRGTFCIKADGTPAQQIHESRRKHRLRLVE